jgi:hypothetical protein
VLHGRYVEGEAVSAPLAFNAQPALPDLIRGNRRRKFEVYQNLMKDTRSCRTILFLFCLLFNSDFTIEKECLLRM